MSRQEIVRNYRKAGINLKRLENFKISQSLNSNQLNLFNRKLREFNILGESLYPNVKMASRKNHNGKVRKYRGILNRRQIAKMPRPPTSRAKVNNFQRRVAQLRNGLPQSSVRRSPPKSMTLPQSSVRRSPPKSMTLPKKTSCFGRFCFKP